MVSNGGGRAGAGAAHREEREERPRAEERERDRERERATEDQRVRENVSSPKVKVAWDPTPDIEGGEEGEVSDKVLLPSLWNKDVDGAWRLDIDCFEDNDGNIRSGDDICSDSSSLGTFGSDSDDDSFFSESSCA